MIELKVCFQYCNKHHGGRSAVREGSASLLIPVFLVLFFWCFFLDPAGILWFADLKPLHDLLHQTCCYYSPAIVCVRVCVCVCVTGAKQFYYGSLTKGSLVLLILYFLFLSSFLFDKHFEPSHVCQRSV